MGFIRLDKAATQAAILHSPSEQCIPCYVGGRRASANSGKPVAAGVVLPISLQLTGEVPSEPVGVSETPENIVRLAKQRARLAPKPRSEILEESARHASKKGDCDNNNYHSYSNN